MHLPNDSNTPISDRSVHEKPHDAFVPWYAQDVPRMDALLSVWRVACCGRVGPRRCLARASMQARGTRYCAVHNPARERPPSFSTPQQAARDAVHYALKIGVMVKGGCEVGVDCAGQVQGHHPDYAKPLDVRWLCARHHAFLHREIRNRATEPTSNLQASAGVAT